MPRIHVESERELGAGWEFDVVIEPDDRRQMTLSWADYELWSGGAKPPSQVAERVVRFAASRRLLTRLRPRFDASTVRRLAPDMDALLGFDGQD